jgi:hypothetical protein
MKEEWLKGETYHIRHYQHKPKAIKEYLYIRDAELGFTAICL